MIQEKKFILKKWWFGLLTIIVFIIVIISIYFIKERSISRDNSNAKETILSAGNFECGKDIPEGRYICNAIGGKIGFQVFKEKDTLAEIVDLLDPNGTDGVSTITFSLNKGDIITIDNYKVKFTPVKTKLKTSLTTGIWEVGIDIKPGKYIARAKNGDGVLTVYNRKVATPTLILNADLDSSGMNGMKQIECELNNGETINIGILNEVDFEKK